MRDLPEDCQLRRAARDAAATIPSLLEAHGLQSAMDKPNCVTPPGKADYYEWYYAYGLLLRPKRILEIGVFGGGSAVALCAGAVAAGAHLELVQLIDDESGGCSLAEAVKRVRAIVGEGCAVEGLVDDSQRMRELRLVRGGAFDVISIDGDHRVGPCYHDLRITLPHLHPKGHVICDDGRWPWVRDAVTDFVAAHPELELDDLYVETYTGTRLLHRCYPGPPGPCPLLK